MCAMADEGVLVDLSGLTEILKRMDDLAPNIQTRMLNGAMRAGASTVQKEVQSRAPVLQRPTPDRVAGLIKANVAVRKMTKRRLPAGMATGYSVGVLGGATPREANTRKNRRKGISGQAVIAKERPFYWRYVELGTEKQPARPFVRPGFDASKLAAVDAVRVYLTANLYKAIDP
jgi:HK97 gp10 family phage protein